MFKVLHSRDGKFQCVQRSNADGSTTSFGPGSNMWDEFLTWNAKQQTPLDLSDKAPDQPSSLETKQQQAREFLWSQRANLTPVQKALAILLLSKELD